MPGTIYFRRGEQKIVLKGNSPVQVEITDAKVVPGRSGQLGLFGDAGESSSDSLELRLKLEGRHTPYKFELEGPETYAKFLAEMKAERSVQLQGKYVFAYFRNKSQPPIAIQPMN
ncbi:hypothetical protein COV18_03220 [Candidatus Woesearchaeota archaeon CG10_big_fil_rev_8_21_14_0_10_37_12]|nr:MAG: hypothetical protein COV18_03220 [Candidatus Woesearchaeota archaeon CG10_big_fil_rev_8_21_14_0_10_37_12]